MLHLGQLKKHFLTSLSGFLNGQKCTELEFFGTVHTQWGYFYLALRILWCSWSQLVLIMTYCSNSNQYSSYMSEFQDFRAEGRQHVHVMDEWLLRTESSVTQQLNYCCCFCFAERDGSAWAKSRIHRNVRETLGFKTTLNKRNKPDSRPGQKWRFGICCADSARTHHRWHLEDELLQQ